MYDAMDSFLNVGTWHTNHDYDKERFYIALSKIVRAQDFNADEMREYFRSKKNVTTRDGSNPFEKVIDELATKAWAVSEYLSLTGE